MPGILCIPGMPTPCHQVGVCGTFHLQQNSLSNIIYSLWIRCILNNFHHHIPHRNFIIRHKWQDIMYKLLNLSTIGKEVYRVNKWFHLWSNPKYTCRTWKLYYTINTLQYILLFHHRLLMFHILLKIKFNIANFINCIPTHIMYNYYFSIQDKQVINFCLIKNWILNINFDF